MPTEPKPIRLWGSIPPPERLACQAMAFGTVNPTGFVPVDTITPFFLAHSPSWYELRRDTWRDLWNVTQQTVTIDEVEVEVYLVDQQWMTDLYPCVLSGDCDPEDDYTQPLNYMTMTINVVP